MNDSTKNDHPARMIPISAWKTLVLAPAAAVAALLFLNGCGRSDSHARNAMPAPEVTVMVVEPKSVPVTYEYVGQTAGSREVEVRARVTGILKKRNYQEGKSVVAGQSLFTIDPTPFEAALARAEAAQSSAEARLEQARRNGAQLKSLYEVKAVSRKEYDDAVSAEAIAAADMKSARASLTEAKLGLGYTRVESPITGIAGRALRSDGNYVSGPDVLLTTVSQLDPIYVLFGISDEERLKLRREVEAGRLELPSDGNFNVSVKLADGSIYEKSGHLNFSDIRISGNTGTSEARAELPNTAGMLRPGQFVRVTLNGATRPNAILVPQRAVLEGQTGKFVYVMNAERIAEARPVEVGDWTGDEWIISSGLNAGDRVIVDGVIKIRSGAAVQVATSLDRTKAPGE